MREYVAQVIKGSIRFENMDLIIYRHGDFAHLYPNQYLEVVLNDVGEILAKIDCGEDSVHVAYLVGDRMKEKNKTLRLRGDTFHYDDGKSEFVIQLADL